MFKKIVFFEESPLTKKEIIFYSIISFLITRFGLYYTGLSLAIKEYTIIGYLLMILSVLILLLTFISVFIFLPIEFITFYTSIRKKRESIGMNISMRGKKFFLFFCIYFLFFLINTSLHAFLYCHGIDDIATPCDFNYFRLTFTFLFVLFGINFIYFVYAYYKQILYPYLFIFIFIIFFVFFAWLSSIFINENSIYNVSIFVNNFFNKILNFTYVGNYSFDYYLKKYLNTFLGYIGLTSVCFFHTLFCWIFVVVTKKKEYKSSLLKIIVLYFFPNIKEDKKKISNLPFKLVLCILNLPYIFFALRSFRYSFFPESIDRERSIEVAILFLPLAYTIVFLTIFFQLYLWLLHDKLVDKLSLWWQKRKTKKLS